jgi:hypothetical protein
MADPQSSSPLVEQISRPSSLEMTPSSSTTPLIHVPAPPSELGLNPKKDGLAPQMSAPAASQSTDEGTALIFRLCNYHVPPNDITHVVAIMDGHDRTTVEEAELLRRLYNLHVPAEDINLIIDAMQRREKGGGVARGAADIGQEAEPPPGYDSKWR